MRIEDKVNNLYEKCLYSKAHGNIKEMINCEGIYFDPSSLNKNENEILKIKKRIDSLREFKDKPIYQEEIGDSAEKLDILYKALQLSSKEIIDNSHAEKSYEEIDEINDLLAFLGIQIKYNSLTEKLVNVYSSGKIVGIGKVKRKEQLYNYILRTQESTIRITSFFSGNNKGSIYISVQKKNGDSITINKTDTKSIVRISLNQEDKNIEDIKNIMINNNDNSIVVRNNVNDINSNNIISSCELHIIKDSLINKLVNRYIDDDGTRRKLEKIINLNDNTLFSTGWDPLYLENEQSKIQIYDELMSHKEIKEPIIVTLNEIEEVLPGIKDYLINKHPFIRNMLVKKVPISEKIDRIINSSYESLYDKEIDSSLSNFIK